MLHFALRFDDGEEVGAVGGEAEEAVADVIHFPVEEPLADDGSDFHLIGDPSGAILGEFFLGKLVGESKPLISQRELARLLTLFFDAADEAERT